MKNYIISLILRVVLLPLTLLPVRKNRVLFVSYRGKQYSCNPRYISQALEGSPAEIIWGLRNPEEFAYLRRRGIKTVSDHGIKFLYYALTARVVVTNTYYKPYIPRRKGTFYLRTWHGGGAYKKVTYPSGAKGRYIRLQQSGADLYLSSSEMFTRQTIRETFGYTGEVLEKGMPRNDVLISEAARLEAARAARSFLGIDCEAKICLYAPTWRDSGDSWNFGLDTAGLRNALETRFGGKWLILFRGHHTLDGKAGAQGFDIDAGSCPDMQELLAASDVLVTDYSSSIWDMSLTGKPAFLYCTDLGEYSSARDFYTDIHTWPYPLAENNAELEQNILNFDPDACARAIREHHKALGIRESGHAAEICAERILRECGVKA